MLNIHDFYSPLSTKEILAAIPEELKALKQYVIWDWEPRPDGKKPRKRIVKCTAKTLAASNQPQDWSTLDYALKQLENKRCDGISFVITPNDPYCGIDLDNIWRSDADEAPRWAQRILDIFKDTYGEASPSGSGYKIWCKARLPENSSHEWIPEPELESELNGLDSAHVEIYDRNRFFTLTGRSNGIRVIADCQDDLTLLVRNLEANKAARDKQKRRGAPPPGTEAYSQQIAEKKRHPTLKSIAGSLVFYGIDPVIIEATLLAINQEQCQNKYDLKHIQDLIAYTIEKERQKWAK